MSRKNIILPALGGLISGALVHWSTGYNQELMVAGMGKWLLTGILSGLVTLGFIILSKERPLSYIHMIVAGTVGAVLLRVLSDVVFIDPTHHNLWPFEILFTAVVASIFSYGVGLPAHLLKKRLSGQ